MKSLSITICNKLQDLFFTAPSFEYAVIRLKDICKKYQVNSHLLDSNFEGQTIQDIDSIYLLIISK